MSLSKEAQQWLSASSTLLFQEQFARAVGLHHSTVRKHLKRERTTWQQLLDEERLRRYNAIRNEGMTLAEQAEHLGFDTKHGKDSLSNWRRRMIKQGRLGQ